MAENGPTIVSFERTTVIILRRAPTVSLGAHTATAGHIPPIKAIEITEWDIAGEDALDMDGGVSCLCAVTRPSSDRLEERGIAAVCIETGKELGPWMTC